jgi:hypothetical protein
MSKFPLWLRLSLLYPIASLLFLLIGRLLPHGGISFVLGLIGIEMNFPGAILIWLFWDFSHAYNAFWPFSLGIIFLNWTMVVIPLSWLASKLIPRLKSLL